MLIGRALGVLAFLCGVAQGGHAVTFSAGVPVTSGDVIDFAVGFGTNGSFNNDTTGLAATITLGAVQSNVATDFSAINNPNGVWQYGWSDTLGSQFVISTHPAVRDGVDTWRGDLVADGNPGEYHNGTSSVVVLGNTALMHPGQFAVHPGPSGEYAVVRYVAPETGMASIQAEFTGLDIFGTTTDVHVLVDGTSIFDAVVPEPEAALLMAAGLVGLAGWRRINHPFGLPSSGPSLGPYVRRDTRAA